MGLPQPISACLSTLFSLISVSDTKPPPTLVVRPLNVIMKIGAHVELPGVQDPKNTFCQTVQPATLKQANTLSYA